jgi:exopolysaccharide/PEP-CTERM locus tyrosine autokinase
MGRIEDALHKLQARSAARSATRSDAPAYAVAQPSLDRLATLGADASEAQAYGGKRIEIDLGVLRSQGLLAPDSEERRLAEEYRVIKRPILRNAKAVEEPIVARGNLLMVASALSGEGKTFTCVNLCLSIAQEKDWTVVLVDGDCSKPHLTKLFAAESEPGLLDLLRNPALEFESLVMPTNIPGLSLLPAGSRDTHSSELLASERMRVLCARLSAQDPRRMVVFDSSPLLLTTEAAVLASHVGQVVVIVLANRTAQQAVQVALDKLDASKVISCVLNRSDSGVGIGYGESYGYGTYGSGQ